MCDGQTDPRTDGRTDRCEVENRYLEVEPEMSSVNFENFKQETLHQKYLGPSKFK